MTVRRQPRVAILPTGTELVSPGTELKAGDIVEFNSLMLAGQVREWGGVPTCFPPTPDDFELLRQRVAEALEGHDVVVINAGSSAGSEDYTASVVEDLGELLVHGVAIRPGHPVVLGVCRGKPVLGIPGYPVSAVLTSELFLGPLLYRMLGPTRPGASAGLRDHEPQSTVADGRRRVRARQARPGRRPTDRHATAAWGRRHHVAGACRRPRPRAAIL